MRTPDRYASFFPPDEVISQLFGLRQARSRRLNLGHGAQRAVTASDGTQWVLKQVRSSDIDPPQLETRLQALMKIREQSSPPLAPALRAGPASRFLAEHEGRFFYLMERVSGRKPNYRRPEDVQAVLVAQARLHAAAARLPHDQQTQTTTVSSLWQPYIDSMQAMAERLEARDSLAAKLARRWHPLFVQIARFADTWLRQQIDMQAPLRIILRHGDAHENNYVLAGTPPGQTWLLDLESAAIGPAIVDAAVPLRYFGFHRHWPPAELARLISAYEHVRPMEPAERALLAALLAFPTQWKRAVHQLLKPGRIASPVSWRKITRCLRERPAKYCLAQNISQLIPPRESPHDPS